MSFSKNLFLIAALASLGACSSSSKGTGGARQACYANGSCNTGLICLSSVCVAPPDGGAGTTGTAGAGGASGGAGATAGTSGADAAAGTSGSDAAAGTSGADAAAGMSGGDAAAGMSGGDAAVDAPRSDVADAATCPYKSSYGNVIIASNTMFSTEQTTPVDAGVPHAVDDVQWDGVIRNLTSTPDEMAITLETGSTPFGSTLTTGTIDLSTEKDGQTCGACVVLSVTLDADGLALLPTPQYFIAMSGTLTVTAVPTFPATASSRITGSVSNAVFEHVNIDPDTNATTKIDDCQITVTSAAFDAPVTNN
jgi:hypothetical protein